MARSAWVICMKSIDVAATVFPSVADQDPDLFLPDPDMELLFRIWIQQKKKGPINNNNIFNFMPVNSRLCVLSDCTVV